LSISKEEVQSNLGKSWNIMESPGVISSKRLINQIENIAA
jgi:hypothetical protein